MPDRTLPLSLDTQVSKIDDLSVRISASAADLTQDIAMLAQDYLQSLLQQQKTVSIILATGNSQLDFLQAIGRGLAKQSVGEVSSLKAEQRGLGLCPDKRLLQDGTVEGGVYPHERPNQEAIAQENKLDWSRIILFHLDEYLGIAADHPGSFRYYLRHKVELQVQPRQFHYIAGDAQQPLAECDRYSNLLQQQTIDLCMLGIGDNGHLAFNEPSVADFNDPQVVKLVKLETKTRQQQVNGGYFADLAAVPSYAYTLTIPTICAAKQVFCLAGGSHKAEVVRQTLTKAIAPNFPATILRTLPQATLFCDRNSFS
jgi:glucosamine-6-phosphate deaminase